MAAGGGTGRTGLEVERKGTGVPEGDAGQAPREQVAVLPQRKGALAPEFFRSTPLQGSADLGLLQGFPKLKDPAVDFTVAQCRRVATRS